MLNDYEVRGEVTAIFLKRVDGIVSETLISTIDLDLMKSLNVKWFSCLDRGSNSYYCRCKIKENSKWTTVELHRILMGKPRGLIVDHKNGNTLDNTRENLRITNNSGNQQNLRGARKNSKTGVRGVVERSNGKFRAFIHVNGKQKNVGQFASIEEATEAVKVSRAEYMPFSREAGAIV